MIAYVYKPTRTRKGKKVSARLYRGRYRLDDDFAVIDVALNTADKEIANKRIRDLVTEAQKERDGILTPKMQREAGQKGICEHLKDFLGDLEAVGRAPDYRNRVRVRVRRLIEDRGWKRLKDVSADDFVAWRARQDDMAPKTLNEYLNACSGFLNWLIRQGRLTTNPLLSVSKVDVRGKQLQRRALTAEEVEKLLEVSGERSVTYLTAIYTGLRQNELRQLVWADVHLDREKTYFLVRSATTKNRKDAIVPLHARVVDALKAIKPERNHSGTPVFELPSNPDRTIRNDLKAAGIERVDALGRKVDFHSLRNTFATMLARHGVPQRIAQELMRHSNPHLTATVYTDALQLPTFEVIQRLGGGEAGLPGRGEYAQIDSQKSGAEGHLGSHRVRHGAQNATSEVVAEEPLGRELAEAVTTGPMAERGGFEPPTPLRVRTLSRRVP